MASSSSPTETRFLTPFFIAFFLFIHPFSSSAAGPESSPSPSPSPSVSLNNTPAPSPSPDSGYNSPPAPPPPDLGNYPPSPAPTPTPGGSEKSPSPAVGGGVSRSNVNNPRSKEESSGGLGRGQKAGIAIGVIAGVFIIGIGALVYKKRQQNLSRAQYGFAARREFL